MLSGQGKNEALLGGKGALAGIELCEPFGDNERAGVARCWIPWGSAAKKTAYQGWGEDRSGSCGGESNRVSTHNAVTNTAARPTLQSLRVPATDIFFSRPFVAAFTRDARVSFTRATRRTLAEKSTFVARFAIQIRRIPRLRILLGLRVRGKRTIHPNRRYRSMMASRRSTFSRTIGPGFSPGSSHGILPRSL